MLKNHDYKCIYQKVGCPILLTAKPKQTNTMWIEHIQPYSKGGSDGIPNLLPACQFCNQSKGTKTVEEYCDVDGGQCSEYIQSLLGGTERIYELTDETFNEFIQSGLQLVLYYYTATCPACIAAHPRFEELSESEKYEHFEFGKINVSHGSVNASHVRRIPHFELFVKERVVFSGCNLAELRRQMDRYPRKRSIGV